MKTNVKCLQRFSSVMCALFFLLSGYNCFCQWQPLGPSDFNQPSYNGAGYTSIAIDDSGTPYVAYRDEDNSYKTTVRKFNGTNWVTVGSAGFSAGAASHTSIAIDGSGTPYVVYRDAGNSDKATMMKFNGTNWVTVGSAGFSAGAVFYTS